MSETTAPNNFIRHIIDADLESGTNEGRVHTRFPPEPNGYLHLGHAKSICLNFGIARDYQGLCNLRFDDTNPHKEDVEYVTSIKEDVQWLGFDWDDRQFFASDYFEQLYGFAVELISKGKAYVCELSADAMREYRGTLTEPGRNSPSRDRSVEENLSLFKRMRAGDFEDGQYVLRAKIDMASANINMRDPAIYRIIHGVVHHQTGDEWCIYPMYDFTHCLSDAIEGVTHSLCTLEFEDHRPLYDWYLQQLDVPCIPKQYEFGRLNLEYCVLSKRKLTLLVDEGYVEGWDDPRMPTLAGFRRRGFSPVAIRDFCDRIGVTKSDGTVEMGVLENCLREDLDSHAPRAMAVLHPLKIVITNMEEGAVEWLQARNHPKDEGMGARQVPFTREVYIDRDDFREEANKKYKRLVQGKEVRLRYSYVIRAHDVIKDENGEIIEVHCTYDKDTLSANPEGRKVKGVIQWVSVEHAMSAEVRLYDRLFSVADPGKGDDIQEQLNPDSLRTLTNCMLEPGLTDAEPGKVYQFEREGYFCLDSMLSTDVHKVFNRTITLRDSWGKSGPS